MPRRVRPSTPWRLPPRKVGWWVWWIALWNIFLASGLLWLYVEYGGPRWVAFVFLVTGGAVLLAYNALGHGDHEPTWWMRLFGSLFHVALLASFVFLAIPLGRAQYEDLPLLLAILFLSVVLTYYEWQHPVLSRLLGHRHARPRNEL